MEKEVRAERLRWKDVRAYLEKDDRVLLSIGAVEQHGTHLAMGTDSMTADAVCFGAGRKTGVLVYPPMWYGWSDGHMSFPGTVSLRAETMQALLEDVVNSLTQHGFKRFVIVNGNRRANLPPMQIAASNLMRMGGRLVAIADIAYLSFTELAELRRSAPGGIGHAGEMETSHMLHIHPDCVWMEDAISRPSKSASPQRTFLASDPAHEGGDRFYLPRNPESFFKSTGGTGVAGDPTKASAETGASAHAAMVDGLVRVLEVLRETPID